MAKRDGRLAMIRVDDAGRDALGDFMRAHAAMLMFPLTNLTLYGLGDRHPRAMSAWVAKDADKITDVLAISAAGNVFPCCPNGDWVAVSRVIKGRQIKGFIGEGQQVAALRQATGLTRKANLDVTEPSFGLNIAEMVMPDIAGFKLHPLTAAPLGLLIDWRASYQVETLDAPPDMARERADREIRAYIKTDSHRVLFRDGVPVSMTGFNAQLPEIVQVGGVYTPPELRSRGFARVALAMHLSETSIDGVKTAVLSAANEAAVRTYNGLGFERTGSFAFAIYDDLQVAHG
jgi:ribosomal protein S18 acetylase RimI-like enzyme